MYWFRGKLREEQLKKLENTSNLTEEQGKRDKIISEVCDRFESDLVGCYSEEKCKCGARPSSSFRGREHKLGTFNGRVRRSQND